MRNGREGTKQKIKLKRQDEGVKQERNIEQGVRRTRKKQVRSTDSVLNSYSSGGQKFNTGVSGLKSVCC